jgi:hypothetical protein
MATDGGEDDRERERLDGAVLSSPAHGTGHCVNMEDVSGVCAVCARGWRTLL